MKNKLLVLSILSVVIISLIFGTASAATYYVSNSGSDSNNGLSDTMPWATIAKLNTVTFNPGDFILFKRGDSWVGSTFNVRTQGTSSNPITMSAYGTGNKPIIEGASTHPAIMISGANKGYWTLDNLDLRTTGSSVSMGMALSVQVDYWPDGEVGAVPGWIVQNCNFDSGLQLSGPDTIIRNNVFEGSAHQSINLAAIYLRGTRADNVLIEGNTISNYRGHGMWIMRGCDNVVIRDNTIHHISLGTETGPAGPGHGIANDGYGIKNTNMKIYNNHVGNVTQIGINGENAIGAEYYNNYIHDCGWYGLDIFMYQNGDLMTDHRGEMTGNNFHHNVIVNCNDGFLGWDAAGYTFANNVMYDSTGNERYGFYITGTAASYSKNVTFVNNIIAGSGWIHPIRTSGTYKTMFTKFDNNIIVPVGTEILYDGYDGSRTLAQLQTLGLMTNGLISNPLFIDASDDDFHLQEGSPAINAGTPTGETLDMDGDSIVGVMDIGAYEFQGVVAPETGDLTVTATSGGTASGSASNFNVPATRSISASANSGYSFSGWTKLSGDCTITAPSSSSTTVQVNSGTCSVQAGFTIIPSATGNITATATSGGTATGSATNFNVPALRTISATPNSGYYFGGWTKTGGDCTITNPSSNSTTVQVNSGWCYVQASFTLIPVPTGNITVTASSGGEATGSASNFIVPALGTLTSNAFTGYTFSGWTKLSGDCTIAAPSSSSTTVQVNSGWCYVQANFVRKVGNLTVNGTIGGNAVGSIANIYLPATQDISASANSGYSFASWTKASGDCVVENPTQSQTTVNINEGWCYVQANFNILSLPTGNLTVTNTAGGITGGSALNFNIPALRAISAAAASGYTFSSWRVLSGNCILQNANAENTEVQVEDADCFVEAVFTQIYVPPQEKTSSGGGSGGGDVYIINYIFNGTNESSNNVPSEVKTDDVIQVNLGGVEVNFSDVETDSNQEEIQNINSAETINNEAKKTTKFVYLAFGLLGLILFVVVLLKSYAVKTDLELLKFIESSLESGYSKSAVKYVLLQRELPKSVIRHHMRIVKNVEPKIAPEQSPDTKIYTPETKDALKKYIAAQRAHKFQDYEIMLVLANKGYSKKIIEEMIEAKET